MHFHKLFGSLFIAALSLGFLGYSPWEYAPASHRHVSSCTDPNAVSVPKVTVPGVPVDFFSFLKDDSSRRAAEAYSLFLQSMQVDASLISLTAPSLFGFSVPAFPSYAMPSIANYAVDSRRPESSRQIFGGLMADPQVQFLIHPFPAASKGSSKSSLAAAVDLPAIQTSGTLNLTSGNNIAVSKF